MFNEIQVNELNFPIRKFKIAIYEMLDILFMPKCAVYNG